MKKFVKGLIGIVLGCAGLFSLGGCERSLHEEAMQLEKSSAIIRDILKIDPNDSYQFFYLGKDFHVVTLTSKESKIMIYRDTNNDGRYDKKKTITFPKKLDVYVIPPDPNSKKEDKYKEKPKKEIPEKEKNVKEQSVAYNH